LKKIMNKTKVVLLLVTVMMLITASGSFAMMSGGGGGMMGGGSMMTNTGGFGMMNGMAGAPVVDADGTAYITSMVPSATMSTTPTSSSFGSHMIAVTTTGQTLKMSVSGLMSKPVINGSVMVSTVSLPKMSDYSIMSNEGTTTQQSVVFWLQLPMTLSSVPTAVQMDGRYASDPVIKNNMVYVTTTNFGYGMMQGNDVYTNTYPNMTFNNTSKSYLYIFNMNGTLVSKTLLQ
jgi:hypothetical protein